MFIQKNDNDYQAALAGLNRAKYAGNEAIGDKGNMEDAMERA